MSLAQVYQNFGYRLELLTATEQSLCSLRFRAYDPHAKGRAVQGPGNRRRFFVSGEDGDELSAATSMVSRESVHRFRVDVEYAFASTWDKMHELIYADLDDIVECLRDANQSNLKGYDADNDTADIGLFGRVYRGYEINRSNPDVWRLSTGWLCSVRESEI